MILNLKLWKDDVKATEARIRTLKVAVRDPGFKEDDSSWRVIRDLNYTQAHATYLYCLRAFMKGKRHPVGDVRYSAHLKNFYRTGNNHSHITPEALILSDMLGALKYMLTPEQEFRELARRSLWNATRATPKSNLWESLLNRFLGKP